MRLVGYFRKKKTLSQLLIHDQKTVYLTCYPMGVQKQFPGQLNLPYSNNYYYPLPSVENLAPWLLAVVGSKGESIKAIMMCWVWFFTVALRDFGLCC